MSRSSSSESLKPGTTRVTTSTQKPCATSAPNRPQHAVQGAAEIAIRTIAEPLQVDLVERHPGPQVFEHLGRGVPVRDVGADEAGCLCLLEDRDPPLAGDEGLVVGRGDDASAASLRHPHDVPGLDQLRQGARARIAESLRGEPVLAVAAVVVAAEHAEGEGLGSGQGVEERLLLHRVELEGRHVAEGNAQRPRVVEADPADTFATRRDDAAMAAGHATDAALGKHFDQLSRTREACESLAEIAGRHERHLHFILRPRLPGLTRGEHKGETKAKA